MRAANADVALFIGDAVYGDCNNADAGCAELKTAYETIDAIPEFAAFKKAYDIPEKHLMRGRDGVYASYTFGPAGKHLQIIMLDTRSFMTFNAKGAAGTVLGEEHWQWAWLEDELHEVGLNAGKLVLLSGDRHIGGFYTLDAYDGAVSAGWASWIDGYLTPPLTLQPGQNAPLFEVTVSGLNTAISGGAAEPGPHRVPAMPVAREDHFGTQLLESLAGSAFFPAGTFAADALLRETELTTVSAIFSGGEYTKLRQDSYWQVPGNWLGKAFISGPGDGQGVQHLGVVDGAQTVRVWQNNEVPAGGSTTPTAPLRYYDVALKHSSGKTTYEVIASGLGIKRIYVSDGVDTITLMNSSGAVVSALNGLEGPVDSAGFEDALYMGDHEDGTFGGLFVLDVETGGFYLLPVPLPRQAETATPIYSGSKDYVAIVLNVYPESDGQYIHLWVGKKIDGSDFLARNGMHPAHGRHYVISNDGGFSDWPEQTAQETYAATFLPRSSATAVWGTSSNKNEWSSVNKRGPTMWAQSLEGDRDVGVFSVDVSASVLASGDACPSLGGSPLPCSMPATMKRLGIQKLMDPDFEDPDSAYRSPRGYLLIAEGGSLGRLLRLDLDEFGMTRGNLTLARVSDASLVTDLNSVPPMTIPENGVGQGEFTGFLPHGFWRQLGPDSDAAAHLAREVGVLREQYLVNLQLHGNVEGIIGYFPAMYAWDAVASYNDVRFVYCAANDCAETRGPFVAGDVVLLSDFESLETWLGLPKGTYTNDVDVIVLEALGAGKFEKALPYAWAGVGFYNNVRIEYCAANDCSSMRGPYVSGDVVLSRPQRPREMARLAPGTNELVAVMEESLNFNNFQVELAIPLQFASIHFNPYFAY
ncbi:hypothetical protein M885DRAFT_575845 [Pelagophyceae sp. CCMP2097]|nr:hypothetical protein M885DRAFT_575845 [Pelagophyceae sp. CCMP2097]